MALSVPAAVCFFTSSSHWRAMDWGETMRVVLASMGYKGERAKRSTMTQHVKATYVPCSTIQIRTAYMYVVQYRLEQHTCM